MFYVITARHALIGDKKRYRGEMIELGDPTDKEVDALLQRGIIALAERPNGTSEVEPDTPGNSPVDPGKKPKK